MKNVLNLGVALVLLICLTGCCSGKGKLWWGYNSLDCTGEIDILTGFVSSNINEGVDYGDNNDSKLGLQLGVNVLLPLKNNLRLETGLAYASKGSKSSYNSQDGEESFSQEDKLNLSYLEAPILARYRFKNTGFSAYSGLQPALLLNAKQKSEATGSSSQDMDVKDRFKSFDTSAVFGVGYEFKNGLMLNAGYDLGLRNIAENTDFGTSTVKNRAFKVSLAYIFGK